VKMTKYIYTISTLFITAFFISSCGDSQNKVLQKGEFPVNIKTQSVEVEKPQFRSFNAEVLITGSAEPNQKVTIYAMESGYVEKIMTEIGDFVHKGDVLAELENPNLHRKLQEKTAQLNAKKAIYNRLKSSYKKTPALTPMQVLEDAKSDYLTAKASLNTIEERLNFLNVKAPFSGLVTRRMVDHGALVQSGLTEVNPQALFEVQEISPIRITIPVPESDIATLKEGLEVTVNFPELPGELCQAKVSRMSGALDPASKTMQVEIDLDNSKGVIKSGMYAKVLMEISSRSDVVSLPVTAQWIYQDEPFVFIVNKENTVERIPLKKGLSNKDYFEILNPEITRNTLVIIQGKGLVKDGQIVNPAIKAN